MARFRVNLFRQRGSVSCVMRVVNSDESKLWIVSLPQETLNYFRDKEKGLVLVTGPTGSGKSTTLARIIDEINQHHAKMIVTLEDPIEYLHRSKKSICGAAGDRTGCPQLQGGFGRGHAPGS